MQDMVLKVECPNDGSECSVVGGKIMESMVLLGDGEQNMQCLACGFGSNNNMKEHISDKRKSQKLPHKKTPKPVPIIVIPFNNNNK